MGTSPVDGLNSWLQATNSQKTRHNVPGRIFPSNAPAADPSDPVAAFTAFMNETPAQRMQNAWLQQHGITPDQFASMSTDDKQKVLDQMKRELEQTMKQNAARDSVKGSFVNTLA